MSPVSTGALYFKANAIVVASAKERVLFLSLGSDAFFKNMFLSILTREASKAK